MRLFFIFLSTFKYLIMKWNENYEFEAPCEKYFNEHELGKEENSGYPSNLNKTHPRGNDQMFNEN